MYEIKETDNGYNIKLTRGDYFATTIDITDDGEDYAPQEGDVLRFAMKHNRLKDDKSDYTDAEPLLSIQIPTDTCLLQIQSSHTKELDFGKYVYDIQLTRADHTENQPYTFIKGIIELTPEVD